MPQSFEIGDEALRLSIALAMAIVPHADADGLVWVFPANNTTDSRPVVPSRCVHR